MKKKCAFVASHERHIARLMQAMLEREGYEVVVAHDSHSCWDKVFYTKPDLLVIDLSMPNARQLLERLKASEEMKVISNYHP